MTSVNTKQEALLDELLKDLSLSRLWYTGPPMKGGTPNDQRMFCRSASPPRGVPGLHELDARRVSAAGPALRGRLPSPYGGVAPRWETPGPPASFACIKTAPSRRQKIGCSSS